jgi:hypothetical protein
MQYPRGAERGPVKIDGIEEGDTLSIDFENGIVIHEGNEYHFPALPKEVLAILEDGGLILHMRKKLCKVRCCNSCLGSSRQDRFQLLRNFGHISIPDY